MCPEGLKDIYCNSQTRRILGIQMSESDEVPIVNLTLEDEGDSETPESGKETPKPSRGLKRSLSGTEMIPELQMGAKQFKSEEGLTELTSSFSPSGSASNVIVLSSEDEEEEKDRNKKSMNDNNSQRVETDNRANEKRNQDQRDALATMKRARDQMRKLHSMIEVLTNKLARRKDFEDTIQLKYRSLQQLYGEHPTIPSQKNLLSDLRQQLLSAQQRTAATRTKLHAIRDQLAATEHNIAELHEELERKSDQYETTMIPELVAVPKDVITNRKSHDLFVGTIYKVKELLRETSRPEGNKNHISQLCDRLLSFESDIYHMRPTSAFIKAAIYHVLTELTAQGIKMPYVFQRFKELNLYDEELSRVNDTVSNETKFKRNMEQLYSLADKLNRPDAEKNQIKHYANIVQNGYLNHSKQIINHSGHYNRIVHAMLRLEQLGVRIPFVMEEMKRLKYDINKAIDSVQVFEELRRLKARLLEEPSQSQKVEKLLTDLDILKSFITYSLEGDGTFDPTLIKKLYQLMVRLERLNINLPLTAEALHKLGLSWHDFVDTEYFLMSIQKMESRLRNQSSRPREELNTIFHSLGCLTSFIKEYEAIELNGDSKTPQFNTDEICHAAHILYSSGIMLVYCNEVLDKLGFTWRYYPEFSIKAIETAKDLLQNDETKTIHEKGNILTLLQTLEKGIERSADKAIFHEMKIESFKLSLSTLKKSGCKITSVELTFQAIIDGSYLKALQTHSSNGDDGYFKTEPTDLTNSPVIKAQSQSLDEDLYVSGQSSVKKSSEPPSTSSINSMRDEIEEAIINLSTNLSLNKKSQDTMVSALSNILSFFKISMEFRANTVPSMWKSTVQMSIDVLDLFSYLNSIPKSLERLNELGFVIPEQYIDDDELAIIGRNTIKEEDFVTYDSDNDENIDDVIQNYNSRMDQSLRMTNIYNASDASSLRDLLEGLKEIETEVEGEEMTPNELTVNLLKHQRQGLRWLLSMEKSSKKGGLLADDMGLGKTVQSLALIVSNKPEPESKVKTTLVVAPVSVLRVWKDEAAVKIKRDANLKVIIYGGGENNINKFKTWEDIAQYDIVLVSYQTLASELKKHWPASWKTDGKQPDIHAVDIKLMNQIKKKSEYFSPFYRNESEFYRIILDEAQNIKNKKTQAARACCTISSTYRWALSGTPIQNNIDELYSLLKYLRIPPYNKEAKFHADIGVVLNMKKAHDYNDSERKRAMKKVQVLLRAIMLRRTKTSQIDGKPILELPEKKILEVSDKLEGEEEKFYQALEGKSKEKAKIMLESKQRQGAYSSILTLLLRLRQACLHSELVKIGESKAESAKIIHGKDFEKDWKPLFFTAKRMTQDSAVVNTINVCLDEMTCPFCMEQMDLNSMAILSACGHCLCTQCVESFVDNGKLEPNAAFGPKGTNSVNIPCLVCKKMNNDKQIVSYQLYDQVANLGYSIENLKSEYDNVVGEQKRRLKNGYKIDYENLSESKKVEMCLDIIKKVVDSNDDEKIVIFSQFTIFFEILGYFIKKKLNLNFLTYDGSMSSSQRGACIETFFQDKQYRIMLISMKAGNSGLTLTCANHVILADPFWNPFVEDQAMDRCHRISQEREVYVHRLLIKSSVEDRIVELQNKKKVLVNLAMDPTQIREVNKLGRRELGFLFGLNALE